MSINLFEVPKAGAGSSVKNMFHVADFNFQHVGMGLKIIEVGISRPSRLHGYTPYGCGYFKCREVLSKSGKSLKGCEEKEGNCGKKID